jgi:hypothetical protein
VNCEPITVNNKAVAIIRNMHNRPFRFSVALLSMSLLLLSACGVVKTAYRLTKGTVVMAYKVTKFAGSTVYTVGGFTFRRGYRPLSPGP